jgi:RNA polymerase sigma-70 factor (ECF subfamily)
VCTAHRLLTVRLNNFLLLEKLPTGATVWENMLSKSEVATEAGGMSADEAMSQYAQGDVAAFEIVYEVVAPRIEGYVRRKVRDSARVEDIVQQTFENMHRARGRFIPGSDVLNWAFAIARNLVIDTGKKAGRELSADMSEENETMGAVLAAAIAGGEELFLARETSALLVRSFGRLTKLQQEVFELVKLEGLSYQQAAATLGITVPSVRMYAHREYLSLREAVGGEPLPEAPAVLA